MLAMRGGAVNNPLSYAVSRMRRRCERDTAKRLPKALRSIEIAAMVFPPLSGKATATQVSSSIYPPSRDTK